MHLSRVPAYGEEISSESDEWATEFQYLPRSVYERWKTIKRRVAEIEGMSLLQYETDEKSRKQIGPEVLVIERIICHFEQMTDEEWANF